MGDASEESPSLWYEDERYSSLPILTFRAGLEIRSSTVKNRSPRATTKKLWKTIRATPKAAPAVMKVFGTGLILAASTTFRGPYRSSLTLLLGRKRRSIGGGVKIFSIDTTRLALDQFIIAFELLKEVPGFRANGGLPSSVSRRLRQHAGCTMLILCCSYF